MGGCCGKRSSKAHEIIVPPSGYTRLMKKEFLELHNKKRAEHQAPALKTSAPLERAAQRYAEKLASMNTGLIHEKVMAQRDPKHHMEESYGENLGCVGHEMTFEKAREDAEKIFNLFYDEIKFYNFEKGFEASSFPKYGHFTQCVWKSSKEIGIGVAVTAKPDKNGLHTFYVCIKYDPPGNFATVEEFQKNVIKAK